MAAPTHGRRCQRPSAWSRHRRYGMHATARNSGLARDGEEQRAYGAPDAGSAEAPIDQHGNERDDDEQNGACEPDAPQRAAGRIVSEPSANEPEGESNRSREGNLSDLLNR